MATLVTTLLTFMLLAAMLAMPHKPPHGKPKPTQTLVPTQTPTSTVTATNTPTPSPTSTIQPATTQPTATATITSTPTSSPTATNTASSTPTVTATSVPSTTSTPTVTATVMPCGSLQALIDAAGATLRLPACVYRQTATISRPLVIDGQGQAEIRGSDVWSNWAWNGSAWQSALVYPNVGDDSVSGMTVGYVDRYRAYNLEQVFLDGVALTRVQSSPVTGQFALDAGRHVLLADNPQGHTVEVSARKQWLVINADGVTVTGMTFRHAATAAFEHALSNAGHSGMVVSNSVLTDAHGSLLQGADRVTGNTFRDAGNLAVDGSGKAGMLIQGNRFEHNGWGGWSQDWQSGAVKMVANTNLTIDGNTAEDSYGPAFWCDIACNGVTISNNIVRRNVQGTGIFFEISSNGTISGNTVCDTVDRNAIGIGESGHANVYNNLVVRSLSIRAWASPRGDAPADSGTFISLHDNRAISPVDGKVTSWTTIMPGVNGNSDANNSVVSGSSLCG